MQLTSQTTSILFLISSILSVHTSPVPSNNNALHLAIRNENSYVAQAIDLERRQKGGAAAAAGGAGAGADTGAGAVHLQHLFHT